MKCPASAPPELFEASGAPGGGGGAGPPLPLPLPLPPDALKALIACMDARKLFVCPLLSSLALVVFLA